jgi:Fe-S oxidoreductase
MCNNNGHCRKFDAGTMCPSYRVTRDEQHLTRGRANTLRLALSGQLGTEGLLDAAVRDTMDLCVSCKGCKRDCPTGIDMAKMKIEVRAANASAGRLRARDRLVAFLPRYAGTASRLRWLFNLRDRVPGLPQLTNACSACRPDARCPAGNRRSCAMTTCPGPSAARKSCCSSIPSTITWNRRTRARRNACSKRPDTPCICPGCRASGLVLRPHVPGGRAGR